jgi:hypothetical protein
MASSSDKDSPHSLTPRPGSRTAAAALRACPPAEAPIPMPFGSCSFDRPPSRQWAPSSISPPSSLASQPRHVAIAFCPSCFCFLISIRVFNLVVHFKLPSGEICRKEKNSDNFGSRNEVQKIFILKEGGGNAETELIM